MLINKAYKLEDYFDSIAPLSLKTFSFKKQKTEKRLFILSEISKQFETGRRYSHKEINSILKAIYDDYATIRRALIDYDFMDRTDDLREYWLKEKYGGY